MFGGMVGLCILCVVFLANPSSNYWLLYYIWFDFFVSYDLCSINKYSQRFAAVFQSSFFHYIINIFFCTVYI